MKQGDELTHSPGDQEIVFAYEALFKSQDGQVVLQDLFRLLDVKHVREQEPIDPIGFAMRQGQRRVYWEIMRRISMADQIRQKVTSDVRRSQSAYGTPGSAGRF